MPTKSQINLKQPNLHTRAEFEPSSLDRDNRSVELVFTTSNPARMARWKGWDIEYFDEILSMKPEHIRMERLQRGAPVLDTHQRYRIGDQIGVVESVRTEGEKLIGKVRFSKRAEVEPIFQDIADGIIKNVSVGYKVHKYDDESQDGDKIKTLRAIDWEPLEVSMVPVPADHEAQVRDLQHRELNNSLHDVTIITKEHSQNGAEMPVTENVNNDIEAVREAEKERCFRIIQSCQKSRLPEAFQNELIKKNVPLEKALQMIIDKSAENEETKPVVDTVRSTIVGGVDENRRSALSDAIMFKHDPASVDLSKSGAREFVGYSMIELARQHLEMSGVRTIGWNKNQIAERALHSASDFPLVLMDAANKRTLKSYLAVKQPWRVFASETTASDFKTINSVGLDSMSPFTEVKDGETLKYGTISEKAEKYALGSYQAGIMFSRKMMINDDQNLFMGMSSEFGRQAALTENNVVMRKAILDNPKMGDGKALFHADHGNLIASGTALDKANLTALKLLIAKQADAKKNPLYLSAKYLVVGTDLEDVARELLFPLNQAGGPNVHGNTLELIVDPYLDGTVKQFMVIADPAIVPFIEVAYLEGARGVQLDREIEFDTQGLKMRGALDFAAKALNWKGVASNPGI